MGIGIVIFWLFLIAWGILGALMAIACYLKAKYCKAEHWLCKAMFLFGCKSCKEACESYLKLIIRACLFAAILTGAVYIVVRYVLQLL